MQQLTRRDALRASALALGGLAGCLSDDGDLPTEQSPVDSTDDGGPREPTTTDVTDQGPPGTDEETGDGTRTPIDHERVEWRLTGDRAAGLVSEQGSLFTATYWNVHRRAPADGSADWTHQLAEPSDVICHDGGLAVGSEFVFATGCDGVQALAIESGDQQWAADAVSTMKSPTVSGDRLYCSAYGSVTILATSDGSVEWAVDLPSQAEPTRPAVADGVAYVGSNGGSIRAIDAGDGSGRVRWTHDSESTRAHVPAIADGTIYVGTSEPERDSGALLALDPDGTRQWRVETTQTLAGSRPIVTDDTVYLGSASGTIAAHARTDGTRRWGFDAADWLVTQPAVDPGAETLYCGSNDRHCYAVDTTDGSERWSVPVGDSNAAPAFDDQRVYATSDDGLYALSRD
jgi:outer membrane protein assembly factor BamB